MPTIYNTIITNLSLCATAILGLSATFTSLAINQENCPWNITLQHNSGAITVIDLNNKTPNPLTWKTLDKEKIRSIYKNKNAVGGIGDCISANFKKQIILCKVGARDSKTRQRLGKKNLYSLLHLKNFKLIQNKINFKGPISINGHFIIDDEGNGIYDIKNKKEISTLDKKARHTRIVIYTKLGAGPFSFQYPTMPTSNGDFYVSLLADDKAFIGIAKLNINDLIKNKGVAKNITVLKINYPLHLDTDSMNNYLGSNNYLLKANNLTGQKVLGSQIKGWDLKKIVNCSISPDTKWALCNEKPTSNAKPLTLLVNLTKMKVVCSYKNFPKIFSKLMWLWTNDTKKYSGFTNKIASE